MLHRRAAPGDAVRPGVIDRGRRTRAQRVFQLRARARCGPIPIGPAPRPGPVQSDPPPTRPTHSALPAARRSRPAPPVTRSSPAVPAAPGPIRSVPTRPRRSRPDVPAGQGNEPRPGLRGDAEGTRFHAETQRRQRRGEDPRVRSPGLTRGRGGNRDATNRTIPRDRFDSSGRVSGRRPRRRTSHHLISPGFSPLPPRLCWKLRDRLLCVSAASAFLPSLRLCVKLFSDCTSPRLCVKLLLCQMRARRGDPTKEDSNRRGLSFPSPFFPLFYSGVNRGQEVSHFRGQN